MFFNRPLDFSNILLQMYLNRILTIKFDYYHQTKIKKLFDRALDFSNILLRHELGP